jgi:hypothetical protein
MSEIVLPTKRIKATSLNPKLLIIYGPHKVGKTTLLSYLDDAFILDIEDGARFVDSVRLAATTLEEVNKICAKIKESKNPYKYLIIDSVTRLEDIILPYAASLYRATSMGKGWDGTDVLSLPNGAGYKYLRDAIKTYINSFKGLAEHVILVGHLKDKIVSKAGTEVSVKDLDLTGKVGSIICQDADAIGYLYRGENSELRINFQSSESLVCGARPPHLKGKDIKIADYDADKNELVNVDWKSIFPN